MPRQVRLTDPATSYVEGRQAEWGLDSFAEAANRCVLEHGANPPVVLHQVGPAPERLASRGVVRTGRVDRGQVRLAQKGTGTLVAGAPKRNRPVRPSTRDAQPVVRGGRRGCPHPILRRVGDKCLACGATVGGRR